ncbi:MAG: serine hydrolase, partial [Ruminococcus sp.]|nr:serine hydrolase [Candidatus Copronaster equi]
MSVKEKLKLERADFPEQVGVSSAEIGRLLKDFKENDVEVHSLMILRDSKVAYESWAEPYSPNFPHAMYSVSKSFTATAVGFAIEEGLLSLETRFLDIFPEYKPEKEDENLEILNVHH